MENHMFSVILPDEMWSMIFSQLGISRDKESASKCSTYFREILLGTRVHFLFSRILNILVGLRKEIHEANNEIIQLVSCFTKRDLLKCRLVCSTWNTTVAECYQRPLMTGFCPFVDNNKKNLGPGIFNTNEWSNTYKFKTSQPTKVQAFVSDFIEKSNNLTKTPFLGRLVVINVGSIRRNDYELFLSSLIKILKTFGKEIWYVTIIIKDQANVVNWQEWLSFMPNLVSLRIRFQPAGIFMFEEPVKVFSFPELNQLDHLEVYGVDATNLTNLLNQYNRVSHLKIDSCFCTNISNWCPNPFRNLKGLFLKVENESECDIIQWIGKYSELETLFIRNEASTGEYFRDEHECGENDGLIFKEFVNIVEYCPTSLLALNLIFKGAQLKRKFSLECLQLKLPNLKRLKILSDGYIFLDFIQPLRNLEKLVVALFKTVAYGENDRVLAKTFRPYEKNWIPGQIIQFVGFEHKMEKSNIWSVLKTLHILKVIDMRQDPILCTEYTKEKSGNIARKCFSQEIKNIQY